MKVSLEWVREFVDLPPQATAVEVARELTLKTVEVEDCLDLAAPLASVVSGQVVATEPVGIRGHVLASCEVGSGNPVPVVTRTAGVAVGAVVAVALPGARLIPPGGGTPVELKAAKVAGVDSRGVVCTPTELRLEALFPDSPAGAAVDLGGIDAEPGSPLAEVLGFDDFVLEIDNKSLTNRPDLWGHYGIARELAAIYGRPLKPLPSPHRPTPAEGLVGELDPEVCQRLTVLEFRVDGTGPAPLWLRSRLVRIGERSVNLCVDVSNYVMFTVGQPTHVYDAARVSLPLSIERAGTPGKLEIITGESPELEPATPVVRDANGPVALAGVMGGAASAVGSDSQRFVLEAATFRPTVVRRSSQRLGLRTEASARFEKGLDTPRVDAAVDLFLHLLGQVAPDLTTGRVQDVQMDPTTPAEVEVDLGFISRRLGQQVTLDDATEILTSLGFTTSGDSDQLRLGVPTWRSTGDVSLPQDIFEEIARIRGFDDLPVSALSIDLKPVRSLNRRPLDRTIREQLATRAGLREVLTYPWVADGMLHAAGFDKQATVRFEGPPAPDRNSLRPSLVPNLLEAIEANLRYTSAFGLFEVGVVFPGGLAAPYKDVFESLPQQARHVAAAFVGGDGAGLFRHAKGVLEMLRRHCHLTDLQLAPADTAAAGWADSSARLAVNARGAMVGTLGLLTTRTRRLAGIGGIQVACFELDLGGLSAHPSRDNRYQPLAELPESDFDLSVVLGDQVRWDQLAPIVEDVDPLISRVAFVDEFRGDWVPEGHRSLSLRVTLQPHETTLTAESIATIRGNVLSALAQRFGAYLRESPPSAEPGQ